MAEVSTLDFSEVNPVSGPIYIEGAMKGDALKGAIDSFALSGWSWTGDILCLWSVGRSVQRPGVAYVVL